MHKPRRPIIIPSETSSASFFGNLNSFLTQASIVSGKSRNNGIMNIYIPSTSPLVIYAAILYNAAGYTTISYEAFPFLPDKSLRFGPRTGSNTQFALGSAEYASPVVGTDRMYHHNCSLPTPMPLSLANVV